MKVVRYGQVSSSYMQLQSYTLEGQTQMSDCMLAINFFIIDSYTSSSKIFWSGGGGALTFAQAKTLCLHCASI